MPRWKPSANVLFFASVSALGVLILGNMVMLDQAMLGQSGPYVRGDVSGNGTIILMRFFGVPEGAVIRIQTFGINPGHELYVTEGGGAEALREGRAPSHVLLHSPAGAARPLVLDLVRPEPAAEAPRPVREFFEGTPYDAQRQALANASVDVIMVDPTPHAPCPGAEHCVDLSANVAAQHTWTGYGPRAVVLHPLADDAQLAIYALEALAVLGALGSLVALVAGPLRRRKARRARGVAPPALPPADSAEGLMDLVARAEAYLATLRNALAGVGVLLLFLGTLGGVALEDIAFYFDHLKPSRAWQWVTLGGMVAVYVVLVLAWLVALVAAQRELRRFRRRMAAPPVLE